MLTHSLSSFEEIIGCILFPLKVGYSKLLVEHFLVLGAFFVWLEASIGNLDIGVSSCSIAHIGHELGSRSRLNITANATLIISNVETSSAMWTHS